MIDPAQVMEQIDKGAKALDGGGKELGKAITEAAKTELAYKESLEKALLEVRDGYRESGERMPAEDLRLAEAHQKVNGATYAKYLTSKARVDALRAWLRALEAQVSARQSLLRALTEEARAA